MKNSTFLSFVLTLYAGFSINAANLDVATDKTGGNSVAVWEVNTSVDVEIHARIQDPSGIWSTEYTISNPSKSIKGRAPRVAINALGQIIVVWIGVDSTTNFQGLYGSMFIPPVGPWTPVNAVTDSTETIIDDNFKVHITDTGTTKIIWTSHMLFGSSIEMRVRSNQNFGEWGSSIDTL